MPLTHHYDVFIIGSGVAGLSLALMLPSNVQVALISKDDLLSGASQYAQGGIAAVLEQTTENLEAHIQDTLITGSNLCDPTVVAFTIGQAKEVIQWLIKQGVEFTIDPDSKNFHLTQEGGHSQRRILHSADRTGAVIVNTLIEKIRNCSHIHCYPQHTAIDLIVEQRHCIGAHVLNNNTEQINTFYAKEIILATGGASSVYLHTTNAHFTSGDGIAMAWRAGCHISHMEFNQFHPTCLYYPGNNPFLISEVLRGEGAQLTLPTGERFMPQYDMRAEMASRDIVARAIHQELHQHQLNYVNLDITHLPSSTIQTYFPTIYDYCYQQGIDITCQPIPVVPAAHYTCGGVRTNLHAQTNINHLYAIGEVACTGLHGANRLASNSLLECLVFSMSASKAIHKTLKEHNYRIPTRHTLYHHTNHFAQFDFEYYINKLQQLMWNYLGITRYNDSLAQAEQYIEQKTTSLDDLFESHPITRQLIEYRNLIHTARLIIKAAIARKENQGSHYNADLC